MASWGEFDDKHSIEEGHVAESGQGDLKLKWKTGHKTVCRTTDDFELNDYIVLDGDSDLDDEFVEFDY